MSLAHDIKNCTSSHHGDSLVFKVAMVIACVFACLMLWGIV